MAQRQQRSKKRSVSLQIVNLAKEGAVWTATAIARFTQGNAPLTNRNAMFCLNGRDCGTAVLTNGQGLASKKIIFDATGTHSVGAGLVGEEGYGQETVIVSETETPKPTTIEVSRSGGGDLPILVTIYVTNDKGRPVSGAIVRVVDEVTPSPFDLEKTDASGCTSHPLQMKKNEQRTLTISVQGTNMREEHHFYNTVKWIPQEEGV